MTHLRLPAMAVAALVAFVVVCVLGGSAWSWAMLHDDPPPAGPACTSDFGSGSTSIGREREQPGPWSGRKCDFRRPDGSRLTLEPIGGTADRWGLGVFLGLVAAGLVAGAVAAAVVGRRWPASPQVSGVDTPT